MNAQNSADGARPGAPGNAAGPPSEHVEELRAFLAGAPESLREWADEQLAAVGEPVVDQPTAKPWQTREPEQSDDADLALAELGEDDDAPTRPKIHTPMDKANTPVPTRKKRPAALIPVLGLILVAAVVYGVFRLGQPADTAAAPEASPTSTASTSDVARMAELEAKVVSTPDDVATNLELGVLRFNAGDSEGAEELWRKVTEVDPRNPQAWYNLGFLHLAQDPPDVEGARADWQAVLDVAPDSDLAATVQSHLSALEAMPTGSPSPAASPTSTEE
ncbi:Cytochrome c-type biogenesis protein CcmH/NrfG [Tessaracoccus bendigoensis DSM 12906]|uniref:Cytochrome c-type biogenesis protein CcmH/NrfG n=1 Tax=Tessaracoccus bendigoensis DSM 12906 TaxID=1123357 RepID=A0A1M6K0J0_9ACTN|nr:tetratricopeptide repeat protein [Tessaracoccus bendigoensis]SHJ52479.1 Cytochrome c-type biogenesis protein CcmH/NrfG [Tessaracoccus bendigoensis DSM 12906]